MQWYVGALATTAAHLAAAAPFMVQLDAAHQSIALSGPGGYPVRLGITHAVLVPEDDLERRLGQAEQVFRAHAETFVATYDPGVKMSSQHRAGSVEDAWAGAEGAALRALTGLAPADRWRESCCFIYPLPGVHECARCPRLRQR